MFCCKSNWLFLFVCYRGNRECRGDLEGVPGLPPWAQCIVAMTMQPWTIWWQRDDAAWSRKRISLLWGDWCPSFLRYNKYFSQQSKTIWYIELIDVFYRSIYMLKIDSKSAVIGFWHDYRQIKLPSLGTLLSTSRTCRANLKDWKPAGQKQRDDTRIWKSCIRIWSNETRSWSQWCAQQGFIITPCSSLPLWKSTCTA